MRTMTEESALATAEVLLDADAVSDLVGGPVQVRHLRHKPGLSTTGALMTRDKDVVDAAATHGPEVLGWVQACWPSHLGKVRNAVRRAAERGQHVWVEQLPGSEIWLVWGGIDSDPRLHRALDPLRPVFGAISDAVARGSLGVLRYNPHRRLVLRHELGGGARQVLRVTAEKKARHDAVLSRLHDVGVPVLKPLRRPDRRVSVWPWHGTGNLAEVGDPHLARHAAHATGQALARWHQVVDGGAQPWTPAAERAPLHAQVEALRMLDVVASEQCSMLSEQVLRRLVAEVPAGATTYVHGDCSADQVLVDPGSDIRIIDLDRARTAPPAADLGDFAASELLRGGTLARPLLDGYAAAGALVPSGPELTLWTARALLTRVVEPFRAGSADWLPQVRGRLDQVGRVLSR